LYRVVLELIGDSPKAFAIKGNLGALLMHAGKVEEALEILDEALGTATKHGVTQSSLGHLSFNKGKVLGILGRLKEADQVYEQTAVNCLGHSLNSYSKSLAAMTKIPEELLPQAAQVSLGGRPETCCRRVFCPGLLDCVDAEQQRTCAQGSGCT
jgi:tetratricopeptide (TPR) repeat protein